MLSDNLEAVMTETKNGLWIIYSLEERPFNVFVVHERCESIIICFVILSISDDFDHKKKSDCLCII